MIDSMDDDNTLDLDDILQGRHELRRRNEQHQTQEAQWLTQAQRKHVKDQQGMVEAGRARLMNVEETKRMEVKIADMQRTLSDLVNDGQAILQREREFARRIADRDRDFERFNDDGRSMAIDVCFRCTSILS